jgi:ankyrin repeat protein
VHVPALHQHFHVSADAEVRRPLLSSWKVSLQLCDDNDGQLWLSPTCCHPAGHLACVKLLLQEGADIEQRNVMKETPLIRAAHNG